MDACVCACMTVCELLCMLDGGGESNRVRKRKSREKLRPREKSIAIAAIAFKVLL